MELPPITNSLPTPKPIQPTYLSTTINSPFRSHIELELDSIINETLSNFKNQKINKIIFTTPITPRIGKNNYHKEHSFVQQSRNNIYTKRFSSIDSHRSSNSNLFVANKSKQHESSYGPSPQLKFEVQSMSIHEPFSRYGNWNP